MILIDFISSGLKPLGYGLILLVPFLAFMVAYEFSGWNPSIIHKYLGKLYIKIRKLNYVKVYEWRLVFDGKGGYKTQVAELVYGEIIDEFINSHKKFMCKKLYSDLIKFRDAYKLSKKL
jgi:hypothetical protein